MLLSARQGSLARATLILMASFIASRLLGLVRESVLAYQFGTNPDYGAYLAAFRVPDFLFNVIGAGAIGSAFIPVFAAALARREQDDAWRLASAIMNLLTVFLILGAVVTAIFAPQITTQLIVPEYPPEEQALTAALVRVMLVSPVLFGVSGLIMAILNSHQRFFLPSLSPIVYNLAIIFGATVLAPLGLGVRGLAAGVVIGSALHLGVQLPGLRRIPNTYFWTFGRHNQRVREVGRLLGPRVLGMAAVQINFIVNVNLASRLPDGPARVAALSYAWMLLMLPVGVFAQSIAQAVFPTFSAQVGRGDRDALRDTFTYLLRLILFVSVPATVGLIMLRVPYIQLLFQRGQFTAESTALTAYTLQFFALGLVAHCALEIVTRAYYALHDTQTPVVFSVAAMALNVGLSLLLITPLEQGGLALANSIATTVEALALVFILRRRLGGVEGESLWPSLARTVAASAVMGVVLGAVLLLLRPWPGALVAIVGTIAGGAAYLAAAYALGAPEMTLVRRAAGRFVPRLAPH